MIDTLPFEAGHVIGFRVHGKIVSTDIEKAVAAIEDALRSNDRISMVAEIDTVSGMTPEAILKDIRHSFSQLRNYSRFYRAAVITDLKWIRAAAGFEDLVLPRIEVKAFSKADRDAAIAWVSRVPPSS